MSEILKLVDIHKEYKTETGILNVLNGINLSLGKGQLCAVAGVSGSGKSTLLNLIGLLDNPTSGSIEIDGEVVWNGREYGEENVSFIRNRKLGFVFQFHHLMNEFTVIENVTMPCLIAGKKLGEVADRARELLEYVGLKDKINYQVNKLSGGESQRVAIVRAIINEPAVVLADEPTGNLDRGNTEKILELKTDLCRKRGQTFIIATHDFEIARRVDIAYRLEDGRLSAL